MLNTQQTTPGRRSEPLSFVYLLLAFLRTRLTSSEMQANDPGVLMQVELQMELRGTVVSHSSMSENNQIVKSKIVV